MGCGSNEDSFGLEGGRVAGVSTGRPHSVSVSSQLTSGTFIPKCLRKKLPLFPLQIQVRHVAGSWRVKGGGGLPSPLHPTFHSLLYFAFCRTLL
jgi:hypothetical protein